MATNVWRIDGRPSSGGSKHSRSIRLVHYEGGWELSVGIHGDGYNQRDKSRAKAAVVLDRNSIYELIASLEQAVTFVEDAEQKERG